MNWDFKLVGIGIFLFMLACALFMVVFAWKLATSP